MKTDVILADPVREFPSVFPGSDTPQVRKRVETFYLSIASLFERWIARSGNKNTQRSYREAVEGFIAFMSFRWSDEDYRFIRDVSVQDVQAWRDAMQERGAAPSTLNHRISALSRFYTFLKEQAAELRLPILLPNPANTDFFARTTAKPRKQAQALTLNLLHQLFAMPEGDSVLAWRDRALLRYMYAAGARRETACLAQVSDLDFDDEEGPTLFMRLKGEKTQTVGLHIKAYETIRTYIEVAGLESGPLFRTRLNVKSQKLGPGGFEVSTMSRLLYGYLDRLPRGG